MMSDGNTDLHKGRKNTKVVITEVNINFFLVFNF